MSAEHPPIQRGNTVKHWLAACLLLCLLPASAAAQDTFRVSVARMFDRTAADVSNKFFGTVARNEDTAIQIWVSAGLGVVRWDSDHNGEGRIHADASFGGKAMYFSIGTFITSSATGGPALGVRGSVGRQSRSGLFAAGYWEYAAGLPFMQRGGRAGVGVMAGFSF